MKTYRKNDDAIGASLGASVVILNTESLKYFELTEVAARIWELLDSGPVSFQKICALLLAEFEVSETTCQTSVNAFLKDAVSRGLVHEE